MNANLRLSRNLILIVSLFVSTASLCAQGTAFSYQGRLNANAAPYSGAAEFQFTLWDAVSGGNAVATNNPASVVATVADGLFTVTLDFGSNPFNGPPRFLQTDVRTVLGPFTPLTPRQPLTATPYAIYAGGASAAGLSGVLPSASFAGTYGSAVTLNNAANAFVGNGSGLTALNASELTSGTVSDARLSANVSLLGPTIESAEITDGTIVDADISGSAAIADTKLATIATAGKVANSALSGNVSLLGQTIESAEITDGTVVDADISGSAAIADTKLATISTAGKVADSALSSNVALRTGGNTFSGDQVITNGNVGIGTTSPATPLHVNGTVTATSFAGDGGALTGLNASNLTSGTVPEASLSASVSLLGATIDSAEIADGTIANADISGSAAIADTKLATIATAGKVANSALSGSVSLLGQTIESAEITDGTIADADISGSAAIADTKLATIATAGKVANSALSSSVSLLGQSIDSAEITDGTIVNADISGIAAIADTKLATIATAGKVANSALSSSVSLLGQTIESAEITDGTIATADVNAVSFNTTFWRNGGNASTTPGTHFLGTTDNQPLELKVNGARALRLEPGAIAPNVLGGSSGNYITPAISGATIAGGGGAGSSSNVVAANFGTVSGGHGHVVSGVNATVAGGQQNTIEAGASMAVISGGYQNVIQNGATRSVIGGGDGNIVHTNASYASIGGGSDNAVRLSANYATVGGGRQNLVSTNADYSFIGGGLLNTASGNSATVGGGFNNEAGGFRSTIGGGSLNFATNDNSSISGGSQNTASADNSTIGGGITNLIQASASGATIGGGRGNVVWEQNSTISGGSANSVEGGGGASIGGGEGNRTGTKGGGGVTINAYYGTIAGGYFNHAVGNYSTIGGGYSNETSSIYATVPGGRLNSAEGDYSFAAGNRAKIDSAHDGTFVWADSRNFDFPSTAANQFNVRAVGGVRIVTGIDGSGVPAAGVSLLANDTSWNVISDRNAKKNLRPADSREILDKLAVVPIQRWNYKWEDDEAVPHIGPVAQDFKAAFYPGRNDKTISTLEVDGVALAAIQGLNQKLTEELKRRDTENAELKQRLDRLERLMNEKNGGGQ